MVKLGDLDAQLSFWVEIQIICIGNDGCKVIFYIYILITYISIYLGEWTTRIVHLLNDHHMGVVTAAASLIDALVKKNPEEYKGCISLAVSRLSRVTYQVRYKVCVDISS